MALATANRVKIRRSQESTWGETPNGPATTEMRYTAESLAHDKETLVSQTIRADRQRDALLEVFAGASGDISFELVYGDYEDFLQNAFRGTIASATVAMASCATGASTISATGANFNSSLSVGQWFRFTAAGHSNNGAIAQVASVAAASLEFRGTTFVASAAVSGSILGRTLVNGTTDTSYFIEADFTDITAVKYFTGMKVDGLSVDFSSQQIVTGTFSFQGKEGFVASTSQASTTTSTGTTTPMTAAANVGDILENNVITSVAVQSFSFNLANNMQQRPQVGQTASAEHVNGGVDVTGTFTLYFENITMYQKMVDHTSTSLSVKLKDASGNHIILSLPSITFSSGNPAAPGIDQDIFLALDYQAIRDATQGITARMDFLPAA